MELVADADAFNADTYGHADATPMSSCEFDESEGGLFVVAYRDGVPAGCGGYRRHLAEPSGLTAELKRLFVRPSARRSGLARAILGEMERRAFHAGYTRAILDVGSKQPAAHALYESCGYSRIPGFSIYRDRPGNRAYGKDLE